MTFFLGFHICLLFFVFLYFSAEKPREKSALGCFFGLLLRRLRDIRIFLGILYEAAAVVNAAKRRSIACYVVIGFFVDCFFRIRYEV